MFKSEARRIAEDNLRAAQATGDAETITKALAAYNQLVTKEDRIRGRRARARKRLDAIKAKETPTVDLDAEFDFEPPAPCTPLPPLTPEEKRAQEFLLADRYPKPEPEVEIPTAPAAPYSVGDGQIVRRSGGLPWDISDSPSCGPHLAGGGFHPFLVEGEVCVASHSFSGGEWDELREREQKTAEQLAWEDRARKLYGR